MKKKLSKFVIRFTWLAASLIGLWLSIVLIYAINIPDVRVVRTCFKTSMFGVELCPQSPKYVRLKDIAPVASHAIILSEDASFYSHNGFDWFEIQSAFRKVLENKSRTRGASTITQQLAKNLFLNSERSLIRKLREAYLTIQLERTLQKDEILEKYLNVVEFGPQVYGLKEASQHYFKKNPRDLNILEGAYLATLLPNPKAYSITFKRKQLSKLSRSKIKRLVERVYKHGKISYRQYAWAQGNLDAFPWSHLVPPNETLADSTEDLELTAEQVTGKETFLESPSESSPTSDSDSELDAEADTEEDPELELEEEADPTPFG